MTRVAAIDCGTNSVRLLVADLPDGGGPLRDLTRRMEVVRLGEAVDRTGRLSAAAITRTRAALADYAREIRRLGAERVRMVATSATRDAANADEFTGLVGEVLGIAPEVVSGDEEARLSFAGAVRGLPADARPPYLVVDIGGGSTEVVVGHTGVERAASVDIGCVRMTERHLRGDPPEPGEVAAAEADVAAAVDRALAAVAGPGGGPGDGAGGGAGRAESGSASGGAGGGAATAGGYAGGTLIGLAGSVTTVAAIALGLPSYQPERIHHARIAYDAVAKVTTDLLGMTREQRRALPVMHPGRADVIAAGAMILRAVMARAGASSVVASEHDILDGIAWSLA